jgi:aminoglycoside 6'-N-acetyltransferase I
MSMRIRRYQPSDWAEWLRMSRALFPGLVEEDEEEMRQTLARPDAAVFVLERDGGKMLAGYVEAGSRSVVDGCSTSPVGYIEAWYVDPDARRAGHGRALLRAAEQWARDQGYTEMGSDALMDNLVSHEAHKRSGYIEVDRVVTFRKPLLDATTPPGS